MIKVRTLKPHANPTGLDIYQRGQEYFENSYAAQQKVDRGFVEYATARTKESPAMYHGAEEPLPTTKDDPDNIGPRITSVNGSWFYFSDGEKRLGRSAAADYLGVTMEELALIDVDSNDQ